MAIGAFHDLVVDTLNIDPKLRLKFWFGPTTLILLRLTHKLSVICSEFT